VDETPQKICSTCKQPKPSTKEFFSPDARKPDGLYSRCRDCHNTAKRRHANLVQPQREECASESEFLEKLEWYRLSLDKVAAELVLNNAKFKFTKRNAARDSLDKTLAAMKKLRPAFKAEVAPAAKAPVAVSDADKSWATLHPFKTNYRKGSTEYKISYEEWVNKSRFLDGMNDPPTQDVVELLKTKVEPPKASKAVAIAIRETLPAFVPPPQFDKIFVLTDGFMVYPDNSEAKPPFPLGVTLHRAVNPPGYEFGSHKIARGMKYDYMNWCWFQD